MTRQTKHKWVIVVIGPEHVDCVGPFDSIQEAKDAMHYLKTWDNAMYTHDIVVMHND